METNKTTYDFGNGEGPVPARLHLNQDGSAGGWVSDDSHVGADCRIVYGAFVYEGSIVVGGSTVTAGSRVRGQSIVTGRSMIWNSTVTGGSVVGSASFIDCQSVIDGGSRLFGACVIDNRIETPYEAGMHSGGEK